MAAAADSTRDTHLIVNGIAEDPDGVLDNQYIWDLWHFNNDDGACLWKTCPTLCMASFKRIRLAVWCAGTTNGVRRAVSAFRTLPICGSRRRWIRLKSMVAQLLD